MAHRKSKKSRHPLAKGTTVGVRLCEQDEADLMECARLESEARGQIVHEASLLRELGMPRVRDRLAELNRDSIRSGVDRREGERRADDRREVVGVAR